MSGDQGFMFDFSESDPTDVSGIAAKGKAHVIVTDIKEREDNVQVDMNIVAHETPKSVGRRITTWFSKKGKTANRATKFLLAVGTMTMEGCKALKDSGVAAATLRAAFEAAKGKTFCTTIVHQDWNGETQAKIGFDFTNPKSPRAASYPLDKSYLPDDDDATVDEADSDDAPDDDSEIPF